MTEEFFLLQLVGFILITMGTLYFNEIIHLPGIEAVGHYRPPLSTVDHSSFMDYSVVNLSALNRRLLADEEDGKAVSLRSSTSFQRF